MLRFGAVLLTNAHVRRVLFSLNVALSRPRLRDPAAGTNSDAAKDQGSEDMGSEEENASDAEAPAEGRMGAASLRILPAAVLLEEGEDSDDDLSASSRGRRAGSDDVAPRINGVHRCDLGSSGGGAGGLGRWGLSLLAWNSALGEGGAALVVSACHCEVGCVVLQGHKIVALCADDTVRFLDVADQRLIRAVQCPGVAWARAVCDGVIVCSLDDQSLWACDLVHGGCLTTMRGHDATVMALDFASHLVASVDSAGELRVWDLRRRSSDPCGGQGADGVETTGEDKGADCRERRAGTAGGVSQGGSKEELAKERANAGSMCVYAARARIAGAGGMCVSLCVGADYSIAVAGLRNGSICVCLGSHEMRQGVGAERRDREWCHEVIEPVCGVETGAEGVGVGGACVLCVDVAQDPTRPGQGWWVAIGLPRGGLRVYRVWLGAGGNSRIR